MDIDAPLLRDNDEDTHTLDQLERILTEVDVAHAGDDAVHMRPRPNGSKGCTRRADSEGNLICFLLN